METATERELSDSNEKDQFSSKLVTGFTSKELDEFYTLCEKITLFQAVIEKEGVNAEMHIEDPNLQLAAEHFVQNFRKVMWNLYYTCEDRQKVR